MMFTLGIDKYEEGTVGKIVIAMGVVEKFSMNKFSHSKDFRTTQLTYRY